MSLINVNLLEIQSKKISVLHQMKNLLIAGSDAPGSQSICHIDIKKITNSNLHVVILVVSLSEANHTIFSD